MRRLLATLFAVALVATACGGGDGGRGNDGERSATSALEEEAPSFYDGPPPWPLGGRQVERMQAVGITPLTTEGRVVHYHAHLDAFYDGQRVKVPANVGLDFVKGRISPLHTHADSGVIHVEANEPEDFTLGQFLAEWGVKASDGCVADKCGDEVAVFVNGSIQDTPAPELVIRRRTEIALVLGTPPADIPSSYDCNSENPGDLCPQT